MVLEEDSALEEHMRKSHRVDGTGDIAGDRQVALPTRVPKLCSTESSDVAHSALH